MRISDWSSDVCSSDLVFGVQGDLAVHGVRAQAFGAGPSGVVHRHAGLVAGSLDAEDDQAVARHLGEPLSYAASPARSGRTLNRDIACPASKSAKTSLSSLPSVASSEPARRPASSPRARKNTRMNSRH